MIEYTRNVGCSVRKMTLEDFYEIYLLRSTYEILAVKLYEGNFSSEDIEKMDEILEEMKEIGEKEGVEERGTMVSLDGMLHRIIVEKAGCERLTKSWTELEYGNVVSFYAANQNQEPGTNHQYSMHKQLVDVCRSGNLDKICEEISSHYMVTVKQLIQKERVSEKEFKYKVV
jgi:DNA-binding GntR family transcriptional regulator